MALTQAQLRDHAGRIFLQGMSTIIASGEPITLRTVLIWICNHRADSQFSTEADRVEASVKFLREIFQRTTSLDSELSRANRRIFRKWLDGEFGYGQGIIIEPFGG